MRIITPIPRVSDEIDWELGPNAPCSLRFVHGGTPYCSNPAEWANRLGCCGSIKTVCNSHRDIAASILPRIFICVSCAAENPTIVSTWRI